MEIFAINGGSNGLDGRLPHQMKHPYDFLDSRNRWGDRKEVPESVTAFAHSYSPDDAEQMERFLSEQGYKPRHGIMPFAMGGLLRDTIPKFISGKELTIRPDFLTYIWQRQLHERLEIMMFSPEVDTNEFRSYWRLFEGRIEPNHRPVYAVFRWNDCEAGKEMLRKLLLKQERKLDKQHLLSSASPALETFIGNLYKQQTTHISH
jgi:hypothetical protein